MRVKASLLIFICAFFVISPNYLKAMDQKKEVCVSIRDLYKSPEQLKLLIEKLKNILPTEINLLITCEKLESYLTYVRMAVKHLKFTEYLQKVSIKSEDNILEASNTIKKLIKKLKQDEQILKKRYPNDCISSSKVICFAAVLVLLINIYCYYHPTSAT